MDKRREKQNEKNCRTNPRRFRERNASSRSHSAGAGSPSDGPHQVPRSASNNEGDTNKQFMSQVYSMDALLVDAIQSLSREQKIWITLALFTIASYYGLWSVQFYPTAYYNWKDTASWMTGIEGMPLLLAFTFGVLRSEDVKCLLQAWTQGTEWKTVVDDNLGPELSRPIFKALMPLSQMLLPYLEIFGVYFFASIMTLWGPFFWAMACQMLGLFIVGFGPFCSLLGAVLEFVPKCAIWCSVLMGVFIGGLLVIGYPMVALTSFLFMAVSSNYSNDMKQLWLEAINMGRSTLYYTCTALIWYKLFIITVICPITFTVSLITFIVSWLLYILFYLFAAVFCVSVAKGLLDAVVNPDV